MIVTFTKTGSRRYSVHVEREKHPALAVRSAPGFDVRLPHDLLHFVAEAEFGLDGGIFGDLASGGNARMFVPVDNRELVAKIWRRQRIRRQRLPDGRRSEELAGMLERTWGARRHGAPAPPELEPLMRRLDELAERWHGLAVGGSLSLEWPRAERGRLAARHASAGASARRAARSAGRSRRGGVPGGRARRT
jgi:hypothetical protein